jgi:hypothetical protein
MTDEALFYERFVADVRCCAAGRAPACVAEIERRVLLALTAPPGARDRRWARVVGAISELLAGLEHENGYAQRLRDFVRENADLRRSRDVAITDFRIVARLESVVTANGRRYLAFTPSARALGATADDLAEQPPLRGTGRIATWGVYALCGAAALTALWFAFVVPL